MSSHANPDELIMPTIEVSARVVGSLLRSAVVELKDIFWLLHIVSLHFSYYDN